MSENQGTMKIIKEPDLTATTITAIIIDTNNIIDHMDLVQTEEKITQTQTIEIDIQEEIIAGIPAMDIDINSTLSTEEGGGGDIDREIKGDVELDDEEEFLTDKNQETNIELQNYI
ncbi:unnamed protein product [Rhizophagus irregularis]|nr:unnamed protein product [Rhizophagus irregularis]